MATLEQCRAAFDRLGTRLAADTDPARREVDKSFACHITDLRAHLHGRISHGAMIGLTDGDDPAADVKLELRSDDLLALVDGRLNVAAAWASGRLHIHASFRDLLRLRKLM
jgi:putative sterol carrier protein